MTDAEIDAISANQVTYGDEKVDAFRKGFRAAEARQPSAWDQAIEADLRKEITDKVWAEYSIARQKDATLASISVHQLRTAIRLTLDGAIRALRQQTPEPVETKWPFGQDIKPTAGEHKRRLEMGRALGCANVSQQAPGEKP